MLGDDAFQRADFIDVRGEGGLGVLQLGLEVAKGGAGIDREDRDVEGFESGWSWFCIWVGVGWVVRPMEIQRLHPPIRSQIPR